MGLLPDLAELVALRGAARGVGAGPPAAAAHHGGHRSAQRGRGLEFEEVRAYASGDDARNIDWRVTARRGRPHTKLFREERERPVWLLADLHPGLYFGSRRQLKSALLLRTAALLAWAVVRAGDRLGAVIADAVPSVLPPRARETAVLAMLQALIQRQPREPAAPLGGGLNRILAALRPLIRPGSLVIVLSDFSGLDEKAEAALAALSTHAECRLLWLTDELERQGLPPGAFRVGVPGRIWSLDGIRSQSAWSAAWAQRERRVGDLGLRLRQPVLRVDTGDEVDHRLFSLLGRPR